MLADLEEMARSGHGMPAGTPIEAGA
jgi:hypothetical protein